jgi:high-affinity nickel permease
MFGLDDRIAGLGTGDALLLIVLVAILLGLRHATDPDHLTAVTTLVASDDDRSPRRAAWLGGAWGLGHATSLFAFGVPIVLFKSYLPGAFQETAELMVGLVIMALAIRLLVRWRRHGFGTHGHARPLPPARSPLQAYGIGLVHGMGGSAGVGILLLAGIPERGIALLALLLFAACTAASMAIASTTFGYTLSRDAVLARFGTVAPALGGLSLAFGAWYALGAVNAVPYVF